MEKEVFERMLNEFNELSERISKCRAFLLDEEKNEHNPPHLHAIYGEFMGMFYSSLKFYPR